MKKIFQILILILCIPMFGCTPSKETKIVSIEGHNIHSYSYMNNETKKLITAIDEDIYSQPNSWTESLNMQSFENVFYYLKEIRSGDGMIRPLEETVFMSFDPINGTKEEMFTISGEETVVRWTPTSKGILGILKPTIDYFSDEPSKKEEYVKVIVVDYQEKASKVISENILLQDENDIDPYTYSEIFKQSENTYSFIIDEYLSSHIFVYQVDLKNNNIDIERKDLNSNPMPSSLCLQGDELFWGDYIPRDEKGDITKYYITNLLTGGTREFKGLNTKLRVGILFCKENIIVLQLGNIDGPIYLIKGGAIIKTFEGELFDVNDEYIIYDETDDYRDKENIMIYDIDNDITIPVDIIVMNRSESVYLGN